MSVTPTAAEPFSHAAFKTAKRGGEDVAVVGNGPALDDEIGREAALTALTADEERKLIRRVDWRLIPLLCLLYLVKKIDESNVIDPLIYS